MSDIHRHSPTESVTPALKCKISFFSIRERLIYLASDEKNHPQLVSMEIKFFEKVIQCAINMNVYGVYGHTVHHLLDGDRCSLDLKTLYIVHARCTLLFLPFRRQNPLSLSQSHSILPPRCRRAGFACFRSTRRRGGGHGGLSALGMEPTEEGRK